MVATMRIAEVARRSGFPAATLRYYEEIDLLPAPERTPSGYRAYDESVLPRLAFIARAKTLGCSLEEIADLMPQWDGGRCAPVQDQLRELVEAKLAAAEDRVAELTALTRDLQDILDTLGTHTPDGPCDSECGCVTDASSSSPPSFTTVALSAKPEAMAAPPIACTLEADQMPGRLREWEELLAHAGAREAIDSGVRLQLDATTDIHQLARLVDSEHACCGFFAFSITVDSRGLGLEVRAPADAQPVLASLFGEAP